MKLSEHSLLFGDVVFQSTGVRKAPLGAPWLCVARGDRGLSLGGDPKFRQKSAKHRSISADRVEWRVFSFRLSARLSRTRSVDVGDQVRLQNFGDLGVKFRFDIPSKAFLPSGASRWV